MVLVPVEQLWRAQEIVEIKGKNISCSYGAIEIRSLNEKLQNVEMCPLIQAPTNSSKCRFMCKLVSYVKFVAVKLLGSTVNSALCEVISKSYTEL